MAKFDYAKYNADYKKNHYDQVQIRVTKGTKERWKSAAERKEMPLNQFIIQCVENKILSMRLDDLKYEIES